MKKIITILLLGFVITVNAQQMDYNTDNGLIADGYDVTEYFNNKAIKGNEKYSVSYDHVTYHFVNQDNLEKFIANPELYVPQYGGYCAYAIGTTQEKVSINPKTFEIRDKKLYLFYNSWGVNTLKKWKKEGAETLQEKADANWQKMKVKK